MTALSKYQRLESSGLWRDTPNAQRREVFVSFGNATVVISDLNNNALTHWSLTTIRRQNPKKMPAVFSPDDMDKVTETLEIGDETMVSAIETIRSRIERRRPHPKRLRWWLLAGSITAVLALAVFWLPDALLRHTLSVIPDVKRHEIGQALMGHIKRVSGQPCHSPFGSRALKLLGQTLSDNQPLTLEILPSGVANASHLPGGFILLNRGLIEGYEEPAVVAGYVLAEQLRAQQSDPLKRLLQHAGLRTTFTLLTTGKITDPVLEKYAEHLLTTAPTPIKTTNLLEKFKSANLRSTPYAYAQDPTGETTVDLIEADPYAGSSPPPILTDGQWISLQNICIE